MYGTSEYKNNNKVSPVFHTGWNKAKVEKIEIKDASTGRKALVFKVFGEPVAQEGFKPFSKDDGSLYHGQCGRVRTSWFKHDDAAELRPLITRIVNPMAKAFGVEAILEERTKDVQEFEDFVNVLNEVLTGGELPYIWMNFSGEEYERPGKERPGVNLFFRNITNDDAFKDKTPAATLKRITKEEKAEVSDDLPF